MITDQEALYYKEQLHPAFAGYLQDGTINERDVLATIFQMVTKGVLEPVWEEGSQLKPLVGLRATNKKPSLTFEQKIVERIFSENQEISAKELGEIIKSGGIQQIVKDNLQAISAFPVINKTIQVGETISYQKVGIMEPEKILTGQKRIFAGCFLPMFIALTLLSIPFLF